MNAQLDTRRPAPTASGHPVLSALLVANLAVFALQYYGFNGSLMRLFALWPYGTSGSFRVGDNTLISFGFQWWQLVSYGFMHGGLTHLFFNMFGLWMFGRELERAFGSGRFATYYFVCLVTAAVVQLAVGHFGTGFAAPTVGASGGLFGLLLAYGVLYPNRRLLLLIPPIPIKAKWFVILYGLLELYFGVTGTLRGIAHFAHLGGMIGGLLLLLVWGALHKRR